MITEEWKQFQVRIKEVRVDEWERLPVDDKYRAYIYGIGVEDAILEDLYAQFEQAEQRTKTQEQSYGVGYNPIYATTSFQTANTNAAVNADGSSSSSGSSGGGGGGVGGSGGRSGAF